MPGVPHLLWWHDSLRDPGRFPKARGVRCPSKNVTTAGNRMAPAGAIRRRAGMNGSPPTPRLLPSSRRRQGPRMDRSKPSAARAMVTRRSASRASTRRTRPARGGAPRSGAGCRGRQGPRRPVQAVEAIGEGGMGRVFLAQQAEPVRRPVALKFIKPGMDTRAGPRPVRGRAPGAGADGPPQHRQGARRRGDRRRPPVLRDGAGQGRRRSPSIATTTG